MCSSDLVVLCQQYGQIPATINFKKLNSKINLENSNLQIVSEQRSWDVAPGQARIAGVSSFGSGGANSHVVLSSWDKKQRIETSNEQQLFVISARSEYQLKAYVQKLILWMNDCGDKTNFKDFIYTMQTGRTPMRERLAIVSSSFHELSIQLSEWIEFNTIKDDFWLRGSVLNNSRSQNGYDTEEALVLDPKQNNLESDSTIPIRVYSTLHN